MSHYSSSEAQDAAAKMARANTDPLFILDSMPQMFGGHDDQTPNGTVTFVRRGGQVYAVTAAHVVIDGIEEAKSKVPSPLPQLISGRHLMPIGKVSTQNQLESAFVQPRAPWPEPSDPDIAIAVLKDAYWKELSSNKGKRCIDLDTWMPPQYTEAKLCMAAGYPTEHKSLADDMVRTGMLQAVAELQPGADASRFFMHSRLDKPHNRFFSGMSGGVVYADQDEGDMVPIGIVYEGLPGGSKAWEQRDDQAYFDGRDIVVKGLYLTPEIFDGWLAGID
ncbi:hypothetical protein [Burkholderia ubonensis]|uniref:hypothetical protein n=1 Tax=Burkholderia ubonensis TaxID=101571 RepID=UPI000AD348B4|nr:hypothetical protein [Burkholderia ubonensis]